MRRRGRTRHRQRPVHQCWAWRSGGTHRPRHGRRAGCRSGRRSRSAVSEAWTPHKPLHRAARPPAGPTESAGRRRKRTQRHPVESHSRQTQSSRRGLTLRQPLGNAPLSPDHVAGPTPGVVRSNPLKPGHSRGERGPPEEFALDKRTFDDGFYHGDNGRNCTDID